MSVGVWARWGPAKCRLADLHFGGLAHHLAPYVVPTCHLQCFFDMWWFWFLIIFTSFELDQAWLVVVCTCIQIITCTCGTKWIVPMSLLSCMVLSPKLNLCWWFQWSKIIVNVPSTVEHPGPMLLGKAIIESLKESADLILIGFSTRKYYDCLTKIEGRSCRQKLEFE